MNKHDFLKALLDSLSSLPEAEREKAYAFYAEIIDDGMEDGMSEEEAVGRLGSMDEIVDRIVSEIPITVLIKSRVERKNRGLITVLLLVLGFPLWFPLLAAAASVLLALFVVFWVVDLVPWIVFASLAAASLGSCGGFFYFQGFSQKLMLLGSALACAGCAIPTFFVALYTTRKSAYWTNRLWKKTKNSLLKKRGNSQ